MALAAATVTTGGPAPRPGVRLLAVALLAVAWASAGARPLVDAGAGARQPIDFARDYVAAYARVHGTAIEPSNALALKVGVPPVVLLGAPYYVHPPPASLLILPLVPLGFPGAALAWVVLSLAALGALAFMLVAVVETPALSPPKGWHLALAGALLLLWPPVLHNLAKGQWSILLAALILAGWRALERGRPRAAGVWLGLAASLKATPLLLLGYLVLRHRRAAGAMAVTLATAVVVSLAVGGAGPWRAWLVNAPANVTAWQTWIANTASLNGLCARLFAASEFSRPLVDAPGWGRALALGLGALALAGVLARTLRAPPSPVDERRLFAAWTLLVVVLNPLAWTHTLVIALVPLALLVDGLPLWAVAGAFTLLTVPRETLAALAGPVPVGPGAGLFLSLHAAALLGLLLLPSLSSRSARSS